MACHDCVVTVLLGPPPELAIADEERRALDVLAEGGLVPPLRLVEPVGPEATEGDPDTLWTDDWPDVGGLG